MFGALKGFVGSITGEASKITSRQSAEAMVAIMTGVAYADGEFEDSEKAKMLKAFEIHPVLSKFDKSILLGKHRELANSLEFDTDSGHDDCLKELQDVVNKPEPERIAIMRLGIALAKADGDLEPKESEFLMKCCSKLSLGASQVGL